MLEKKFMTKKLKMFFLKIIFYLIIIYISVTIIVFFLQRNLMYHPGENNYLNEGNLNHKIDKVIVNSEDDLVAWKFTKNNKFKTLLFFHGNAGKLDNRVYKLNELSKLDLNYLIVAYRGFSGNKGKPTEKGLYQDARAAKEWLNSKGIKDNEIILYGESLGTAIAIDLAKQFNFSGVILESPFTSMEILAQKYYPYLPAKYILKDKYKSIEKIQKINSPILVMHGKKDNIVPFYMGEEIYNKFNGLKYSYFNDYDDHMMDFNEELIDSIKNFISSIN